MNEEKSTNGKRILHPAGDRLWNKLDYYARSGRFSNSVTTAVYLLEQIENEPGSCSVGNDVSKSLDNLKGRYPGAEDFAEMCYRDLSEIHKSTAQSHDEKCIMNLNEKLPFLG